MADEIEGKYSKQGQVSSQTYATAAGPSARMREIAHAALQLSDDDIDDFFSDHLIVHTDSVSYIHADKLFGCFGTGY